MFSLIFILAGIVILVKGKVNFSKKRVLIKPKSTYVGATLILSGLSMNFIDPLLGILLFFGTILASFFLSKKE